MSLNLILKNCSIVFNNIMVCVLPSEKWSRPPCPYKHFWHIIDQMKILWSSNALLNVKQNHVPSLPLPGDACQTDGDEFLLVLSSIISLLLSATKGAFTPWTTRGKATSYLLQGGDALAFTPIAISYIVARHQHGKHRLLWWQITQ